MSDYTAKKIRYYRKQRGWTQEQLAQACDGISLMSIRRYETMGKENRDLQTGALVKIARALEVNPAELIEPLAPFGSVEVVGEDGETYTLNPGCDVITKNGDIMSKVEFENARKTGAMSDDDIQGYRIAGPRSRINKAWETLNESGQEKAADLVELVAKVPEYGRD